MIQQDPFIRRMTDWSLQSRKTGITEGGGPVITISREYGCYGEEIAGELAKKLTEIKQGAKEKKVWASVSSHILEEVAKLLEVESSDIAHIFGAEEKNLLNDVLRAFKDYDKYTSDVSIKRTLANVVRSYARRGNSIIVGRAGCVLVRPIIEKSIHVRLVAPYNWRVKRIQERLDMTKRQALKHVNNVDKDRVKFMEFYKGNKPDSELFDLILNRSHLSTEEILEHISLLAKQKGLY